MKILVLEDEQRDTMRFIRPLNGVDVTFTVEGPLASIREMVEFFQSGKTADLIPVGIHLTDGLSLEALKCAPTAVSTVLTTTYDEYAVQASKSNSLDYLLESAGADELKVAIDKVIRTSRGYINGDPRQLFDTLQKNQFCYRERFLLLYRDGYKTVRISDIDHIESESKTVYLRLNNGTPEAADVLMDEPEQQFNPDYFSHASRQYIVNAEYVLFLGNYFGGKPIARLKGYPDTRIIVSKEKVQWLRERIDG